MPRQPRAHVDEIPLHVVQRGHNHQPCFFAESDRLAYLRWLRDALQDAECRLHAYVLMTNHVHLLLTPRHASKLPGLMISLGRRYVQYVNRRYERSGTLWDSRYKSSLVETDTYLLACHRYIEMNPVRAGLVNDPSQYCWSSYGTNASGRPDSTLTPHPLYLALAANDRGRQSAYRELFDGFPQEATDADIRQALNRNQPLGSARFRQRMEEISGIRCEPRPRGRPPVSQPGDDAPSPAGLTLFESR